jgi:hypothetical protein
MEQPDFCHDGILTLMPELQKCINVLRNPLKNKDTSVEQMSYIE